jgi:hypothetical protein
MTVLARVKAKALDIKTLIERLAFALTNPYAHNVVTLSRTRAAASVAGGAMSGSRALDFGSILGRRGQEVTRVNTQEEPR